MDLNTPFKLECTRNLHAPQPPKGGLLN